MFEFHKDKNRYFQIQFLTSEQYIIPFVESFLPAHKKWAVLEIGCAEAGVLKAFTDRGHRCVGIELSAGRLALAKNFLKDEIAKGQASFIAKNIYDIDVDKDFSRKFDLVILKDVIEHIPDQQKLMRRLSAFLNPEGKIFIAFPPWQMPFGGHQQMCDSRFLGLTPYFHLFPEPIYKSILKAFGESPPKINSLLEIKRTGISIDQLEKIFRMENYEICERQFFFTNPIYKFKFKFKVITQSSIIYNIPYLRNFLTTCAYYLVKKSV